MRGLDGERPRLSRAVKWRPVAMPVGATVPDNAPQLRVSGTDQEPSALRVLDALQRAWSGQPLSVARATDAVPEQGQVGVWLADAPLPAAWQAWVQAGGSVLAVSTKAATGTGTTVLQDAGGKASVMRHALGRGQVLRFTAALSADALPILREPSFPRRLLEQLHPLPPPQLAPAAVQAPLTGASPPLAQPRDLAAWLLVLIVLLFALERWMATAPRRGAGA